VSIKRDLEKLVKEKDEKTREKLAAKLYDRILTAITAARSG
jgi:hypothetical protein